MAVHFVGFTLVAEKTGRRGKLEVRTLRVPAAKGLEVGVYVLAWGMLDRVVVVLVEV